jgi:hypothetical protein
MSVDAVQVSRRVAEIDSVCLAATTANVVDRDVRKVRCSICEKVLAVVDPFVLSRAAVGIVRSTVLESQVAGDKIVCPRVWSE